VTPVTAARRHFVFVYGTLADADRLQMLLARVYNDPMSAAVLPGFRRVECEYFYAEPDAASEIEGVLIGPFTDAELAQLDRYEGAPVLYSREPVRALGRERAVPEHPVWVYQGRRIAENHAFHVAEPDDPRWLCKGSSSRVVTR
jgi:hypothetical protein